MTVSTSRHALTVSVLWALAVPGAVQAQSITGGAVQGTVTDSLENPVPSARVVLRAVLTGVSHSFETGRGGEYRFQLLAPGEYELRVEGLGYRPLYVLDIEVRPGRGVQLPLTLSAASPPVEEVDTVSTGDLGSRDHTGTGRWFSSGTVESVPQVNRELIGLAQLSSGSNESLEVEGLPASLSGVLVDGIPVSMWASPIRIPGRWSVGAPPLSAFANAELVAGGSDVELPGLPGGLLSAHTRRGTRELQMDVFGNWVHGQLDAGAQPGGLQGGVVVSGSLIPDTATLAVGVEAWHLRAGPRQSWMSSPDAGSILAVARDTFGVLQGDRALQLPNSDLVSGFGRFDWQLTPGQVLSLRASASSLSTGEPGTAGWPGLGAGAPHDGDDLLVGGSLSSRLGRNLVQEVRFGLGRSRRSYGPGASRGEALSSGELLSSTLLVAEDAVLGMDPILSGRYGETRITGSHTLHFQARERHLLKLGLSGELSRYEQGYAPSRHGEFLFDDLESFARGEGFFAQTVGPVSGLSFSIPRFAVYLQDRWTAAPGLELALGLRLDVESLPKTQVALNQEWLTRTGLDNTSFRARHARLGPRVGFTWDIQDRHEWLVFGSGGIYSGPIDPWLVGEALTNDGRLVVRRGVGALGSWPGAPDSSVAPVVGPALTLLAPTYTSPRTARAALGISRSLAADLTLSLSTAYRKTDLLPRRSDLNLRPVPAGEDQFGRPIYGHLAQHGGLLVAENGSNRNFSDYDRVYAINSDGWSEYLGVTVRVERSAPRGPNLFASYTLSRTRDNWPFGGTGSIERHLSPFPAGRAGSDYLEGISDLDVPHRAVAGLELRTSALGGGSLTALYRFRSGYAFTPGLSAGVDANGDGSFLNDPAFIDAGISGVDALLERWACLRGQVGRVAGRNSCRTGGIHALDVRFTAGIARIGGHDTQMFLEGLNLLQSGAGIPDPALYRVASDGLLQLDPVSGVVTVPLVANEGFGTPLLHLSSGPMLRLGFRVNY